VHCGGCGAPGHQATSRTRIVQNFRPTETRSVTLVIFLCVTVKCRRKMLFYTPTERDRCVGVVNLLGENRGRPGTPSSLTKHFSTVFQVTRRLMKIRTTANVAYLYRSINVL